MEINIKENNMLEIKTEILDTPLLLTKEESYHLFDLLEGVLWDKPTHRELEEKVDQLEYELETAQDEIEEREDDNGLSPQEMYYERYN